MPTTDHASSRRPVALITGGARRVGRAAALALARAGCDVVITYRRSREAALTTVADAIALGAAGARACELDLDDLHATDRLAQALAADLPRLDILVLNASGYDPSPVERLSAEQLLAAFRVNAAGPALLAARLAPRLSASTLPGGAAIVALGDIHALGEHGVPRSREFLAYAMSKAAIVEMVRTLARELAPSVRVNAVAPGVVAWPETGPESGAEIKRAYLARVPLARAGTPEEAAEVIRWLALDATYITGEIIRLDGGRNMV